MNQATLDLDREVPERTRTILRSLPGVAIRDTTGRNQLRLRSGTYPIALFAGIPRPFTRSTIPMLASLAGPELGFVVADRLPLRVRRELEDAGVAYADGSGAAHIDVPGLFLHVQPGPVPSRQAAVSAPAGIGVTGVRVIQALLADPQRIWSVAGLATDAACSAGEAHRIMTLLEQERLLTARGRARGLRRIVTDAGALLDWLATVPPARRIRERQSAFVYEASPEKLVTTISSRGTEAGLTYAFTGVAAAHIYGATVKTAIPVTMIRIAPEIRLSEACSILQAEPVDRGANVALVRDFGMVGVHNRTAQGTTPLAQPVRVWLDMLGEPRGEDAADHFREAVIGW